VVPLWETVTCHTARHTFATLSLLGGMDIVHLADVLGVTLNVVTTYAKTLPTERHRQLLEAWKE